MIGTSSGSLYVLNTEARGESPATRIGLSFGSFVSNPEPTPRSITSHNGKLYMIGSGSDSLYVLNTEATGNPAKRIGISFGGSGDDQENTPASIAFHCEL